MQKDSQECGTVVREQREKIPNEQMGDKMFEDEVGAGVQHQQREGLDYTVEVYVSEESEERVTMLRQGAAPGVRAVKSFEFREGKL